MSKKVYFEIWKSVRDHYKVSGLFFYNMRDYTLYLLNVFLLAQRLPLNLDISAPNIQFTNILVDKKVATTMREPA